MNEEEETQDVRDKLADKARWQMDRVVPKKKRIRRLQEGGRWGDGKGERNRPQDPEWVGGASMMSVHS